MIAGNDWPARKGYASVAAIPSEVRAALDCARDDPRTMVEWLVVDTATLLAHVLPEVGLGGEAAVLAQTARGFAHLTALKRNIEVGKLLYASLAERTDAGAIYARIATHRASVVREWGARIIAADRRLTLEQRLGCARHYAADPHMAVREIAWASMRDDVLAELDLALRLFIPWVDDPDPNVRRCAVECTRPRGVWCAHSEQLKTEPERALHLLEAVRADPNRYVQLSVGNWLNDASRSRPAWVRTLCQRWQRESPAAATSLIVRRALRTVGP